MNTHHANTDLPWIEKYKPRRWEDIDTRKKNIREVLFPAGKAMPNIILHGPPGTGKTTCIACLVRSRVAWSDSCMELNASDDRGADVLRHKIQWFAQKKLSDTNPEPEPEPEPDTIQHAKRGPGPHDYKIVFVDEIDNMQAAAQQALRRLMETYHSSTRFAFACNDITKIVEPLLSRCTAVQVMAYQDKEVGTILEDICDKEDVNYDEGGIRALILTADGDMRQAINNLQATHYSFNLVNEGNVYKICDQPHPALLRRIIDGCIETPSDFVAVEHELDQLLRMGFNPQDIISTLFKVVKHATDLSAQRKMEFLKEIGVCHTRLTEGVQSRLQMSGMLARMCSPLAASTIR